MSQGRSLERFFQETGEAENRLTLPKRVRTDGHKNSAQFCTDSLRFSVGVLMAVLPAKTGGGVDVLSCQEHSTQEA